jgi:SWI/SNF-related matrix-associated actin-dependent regulator 1 of chromatin subfamily A
VIKRDKTDLFYASVDEAKAKELASLGWVKNAQGYLITRDIDLAFDQYDLFAPELVATLTAPRRVPLVINDAQWAEITVLGKPLHFNQKNAICFAAGAPVGDSTIIADPPGGGKTATNVTLANLWQPHSWLIVCPAVVKYNWQVEINMWKAGPWGDANPHVEVLEAKTAKLQITAIQELRKTGAPYVVILNYDIMAKFKDVLKDGYVWDLISYDESHKLKTFEAKRTRFALGHGNQKPIAFARRIFNSATNLNKNFDLWPMVKACDPTRLGRDRTEFVKEFCGGYIEPYSGTYTTQGSTNSIELGMRMASGFLYRSNIDSLLRDMTEETVFLPPSKKLKTEEQKIFADILASLTPEKIRTEPGLAEFKATLERNCADLGLSLESADSNARTRVFGKTFVEQQRLTKTIPVVFSAIALIRKMTGVEKIPHIIAHIKDMMEVDDSPIVLMCYHTEVVDAICAAFPSHVRVTGGVSAKKRQEAVKKFQTGEVPLFVGNILAAGEGITLTKSYRLVFGEFEWNATSMWQALKRIHRLTQTKNVVIQYLLMSDSLDANVSTTYINKRGNIDAFFAGVDYEVKRFIADGSSPHTVQHGDRQDGGQVPDAEGKHEAEEG